MPAPLCRPPAVQGARTVRFQVAGSSPGDLLPYLASVQSRPSMQTLHISCASFLGHEPPSIALVPAHGGPASLPYVRQLEVTQRAEVPVQLALPMPRLEVLTVCQEWDEYWDQPAKELALGRSGAAGSQSPLFPALRRVKAEAQGLLLGAADLPALEELSFVLFSPECSLRLSSLQPSGRALSALTFLVRRQLLCCSCQSWHRRLTAVAVPLLYRNQDVPPPCLHSDRSWERPPCCRS